MGDLGITEVWLNYKEALLIPGPGIKVMKLELILWLKINRKDWLLVDTCPQAAKYCHKISMVTKWHNHDNILTNSS